VEEAKMKRKDSLTSPSQQSPVTPTPKQDMALQAILAKSTHLYEAWKRCKGSPSSHLQSELTSAHSNVQALRVTVCNIESKLKTSQSELSAAESKMDKMKVFWEKTRTAAKEAGLEGDKDHDEWLLSGAHKPVQRAYEDHHRKKEQHDKIVHDLTKAQSLLANAELRVVEIEEERKQVKFFGEFYRDELLPSKNAA
jgi:predicted  nucleic acid-binding Zn-ribbon protein